MKVSNERYIKAIQFEEHSQQTVGKETMNAKKQKKDLLFGQTSTFEFQTKKYMS